MPQLKSERVVNSTQGAGVLRRLRVRGSENLRNLDEFTGL